MKARKASFIGSALMTGLASLIGFQSASANDWPQWRYDDHRSGVTTEQLPAQLNLQWVHEYPAPSPAWDNQKEEYVYGGPGVRQPQMVSFDIGYQPIVVGDYMYFGSNTNDCITMIQVSTGAELHRFYAAGPIRFAPIAKNGEIIFGADDGCMYALSATDLSLIVKIDLAPYGRKVMGNDRMVSIWPVRGGAVMSSGGADSNCVYFACGLYAFEGTGIFCYDVTTGARKWLNDGSGMKYTINPHSTADGYNGVAPQGYLCLADSGKLLIPNGRAVPACFDRATGKMLYYKLGQTSGGGYGVTSSGNYFYNMATSCNLSTGASSGSTPAQYNVNNLQITAGGVVYAADTGAKSVSGGSFSATVDGIPASIVAANGHLIVTTTTGKIYCYGADSVANPVDYPYQTVNPPVDGTTSFAQQALANCSYKQGGKGICLVIGLSDGRLCEEMTLQSDLTVIGIDPDQNKIDAIRARLDKEGMYGQKVQLLCGDILSAGLPPYFASLILSENIASGFSKASDNESIRSYIATMYGMLRPFGGEMILQADQGLFNDAISARGLKSAQVSMVSGYTLCQKVGALPGSADWNCQMANASHTNFVKDSLVKGPLGVLWFGGSSDNINNGMNSRHGHGSTEQVAAGHYYMSGQQKLRCVDAYTGRLLWEHSIVNFGEFSDFTEHEAGQSQLGDNFVSLANQVYALGDHDINQPPKQCLVLDPATGATVNTITMPDSLGGWGLLSVIDSFIVATSEPLKFDKDTIVPPGGNGYVYWYSGTAGPVPIGIGGVSTMNAAFAQHLVVFNRFTGAMVWNYKAEKGFYNLSVASGNGKVFAIDKTSKATIGYIDRMGMVDTVAGASPKVKAFDLHTGNMLWADSVNAFARYLAYSPDYDILLEGSRNFSDVMTGDISANKMIAFNGTTGAVQSTTTASYYGGPYVLNDTVIYTQNGNSFGAIDLKTGNWHGMQFGLTNKTTAAYSYRHYGCNYGLGAVNLIAVRSGSGSYLPITPTSIDGTINMGGFKTGCTPSLVPADGILTNSEYTRTCSCNYQVQTSAAFVYNPQVETWMLNQGYATKFATQGGKLTNVGICLGAPGDHRDTTGTMWCEYPYGEDAAGFTGYSIPFSITVTPIDSSMNYFRHHSVSIGGNMKFVGASGVENASSVVVKMIYDSLSGTTVIPTPVTTENYTVSLVFMEPNLNAKVGDRVFDVAVNGNTVLSGYDIVQDAGSPNVSVVKTFSGIPVTGTLTVTLSPKAGKPILCGFSAKQQM